jgi:hypothetical protein
VERLGELVIIAADMLVGSAELSSRLDIMPIGDIVCKPGVHYRWVEVLIGAGVVEKISREVGGCVLYVEESERADGATAAGRSKVKL